MRNCILIAGVNYCLSCRKIGCNMATGEENYDIDALTEKLKAFALTQTKSAAKMDSKTVGKVCKECWPKSLQTRVDSSVFPKVMDKTTK